MAPSINQSHRIRKASKRACHDRDALREGVLRAGAIEMANKEIADGQHPGAVDLAKNIATTQQQEIEVITDLLTRI
jgi:uncharacterized protein (DUF305 family)